MDKVKLNGGLTGVLGNTNFGGAGVILPPSLALQALGQIEVAPGNLPSLSSSVPPCQVSVQPPEALAMLSAALPATRTFAPALIGSTPVFLRMTCDFATASRAMARCPALPSCDQSPA